MKKIISLANQKGGVGKTTSAINIGACLGVSEIKTLIVDIDPQSNATLGFGIDHKNLVNSIYEILIGKADVRDTIQKTEIPYVDILPSATRLVGAEVELIDLPERESILKKHLEKIKDDYQYIIIDCPPSLGLLTVNALTASDTVIIPIQCEYFAMEGLGQLLNTIRLVQKSLNRNLQIEGVLLTMFDTRLKLSQEVAEQVKSHFGEKVYKTIIRRNVRLGEAPSFGKPIILYDANSAGAQDYLSLIGEILERNGEKIR
ncbi:MAG: ParA family protein [Candidatus Marinimicrobia bacterium]|nr:ParA family protein [Candidatus Neomarinimicrobiota bacterium]